MGDLFAAIEISRQWSEHRAFAQQFFGERYPAKVAPYRKTLRTIVARDGIDIPEALIRIGKDCDGMAMVLFLAAGLDELEGWTPDPEPAS